MGNFECTIIVCTGDDHDILFMIEIVKWMLEGRIVQETH